VRATDCDQFPVGTLALSVHLARVDGTADTANEVVSSSAADVGNTMRFAGEPGNQYIFNLSTRRSQFNADQNLVPGSYHIWLTGDGIAQVDAWFDVKR